VAVKLGLCTAAVSAASWYSVSEETKKKICAFKEGLEEDLRGNEQIKRMKEMFKQQQDGGMSEIRQVYSNCVDKLKGFIKSFDGSRNK
jgi:hypothetical protein